MYKTRRIGRKEFAIWLVIFILLQLPWTYDEFGNVDFYYEMLVPFMIVWTTLLSGIFGIVLAGLDFYESVTEIYTYLFNESKWIGMHSHGIWMPGFSFEKLFFESCVYPLLMSFFLAIHFYFCVRRCKDAGISAWWALLHLYNPFMLLIKRSKIEPQ